MITATDENPRQRLLLDSRLQPFGNVIPRCLERQRITGNSPVDRHDVEAMARLDDLPEDPGRPQTKQRAL